MSNPRPTESSRPDTLPPPPKGPAFHASPTQRIGLVAGAVVLAASSAWAFSAPAQTIEFGQTNVRVDPSGVYNPVLAGESLPDGFRQLLPRDAILPVYEPNFVAGDQIDWPNDAQVIGVALGDEAKAYPVSFLNGREMVVDELDGIPILVTW